MTLPAGLRAVLSDIAAGAVSGTLGGPHDYGILPYRGWVTGNEIITADMVAAELDDQVGRLTSGTLSVVKADRRYFKQVGGGLTLALVPRGEGDDSPRASLFEVGGRPGRVRMSEHVTALKERLAVQVRTLDGWLNADLHDTVLVVIPADLDHCIQQDDPGTNIGIRAKPAYLESAPHPSTVFRFDRGPDGAVIVRRLIEATVPNDFYEICIWGSRRNWQFHLRALLKYPVYELGKWLRAGRKRLTR